MNITREDTGKQTAKIIVKVEENDYQENYTKSLKEYQKSMQMPGFRPGKVPFGMIKRMYGNAVLAEEVNKILSESLAGYITENKIPILGRPLASKEDQPDLDFDKQADFEFHFDVGLAPEIDLVLDENIVVTKYIIKADEETIEKQIESIQLRNGEQINPETTADKDLIKGKIEELDGEGNVKENGITSDTSLSLEFISEEKAKKELTGKKVGDTAVFNPLKATGNVTETSSMLNIQKEEAEKLESDFRFTISEITRVVPAEINGELFENVYPGGEVKTEEDFRTKIIDDIEGSLQLESAKFFYNDVIKTLVDKANPAFPDEFMKRFLLEQSENEEVTPETIDKEYEQYLPSLKWQVVQEKIMGDNGIQITEDDIRNHIGHYFQDHVFGGSEEEGMSDRVNELVNSIMKNDEETDRIRNELLEKSLLEVFNEKISIKDKELTYNEFIKDISLK